MSDVTYKIRVNRPCRLFIDDEEVMILEESKLAKINLPEGEYLRKVVAIDNGAIFDEAEIVLSGASKLENITLDTHGLEDAKHHTLPDGEFTVGDLKYKATEDGNGVKVVGLANQNLTKVVIPEKIVYGGYIYDVTSIGDDAFAYCSSLTSLNLPNSVICIGEFAFSDCSSLSSLTIPNSVTSIGEFAFAGCSSLSSLNLPNSVTSIGEGAFSDCEALNSIKIPSALSVIAKGVFSECPALTSIVVDSGNKFYDSRNNCNAIIETSTNQLIAGCKNTNIPKDITKIGDYAFYGCSSLSSVVIPDSVISIGEDAFEKSGLRTIILPISLRSIEDGAFKHCLYLSSINIPMNVDNIGECVFCGCPSLEKLSVDIENKIYDSRNDCNAINHTTSNTLIRGCKTTIIPDEIICIHRHAFCGTTLLENITIPNGVMKIEEDAFSFCKRLRSMNIPQSVASIGERAFYACDSLDSINIAKGVMNIGESVFGCCYNLMSIIVDSRNINYDSREDCNALIETSTNTLIAGCKNTTITNSVKIIADNAFDGQKSLKEIRIPDSVMSIGSFAFYGCSSLIALEYEGTKEQWKNIKQNLYNNLVIRCVNGEIYLRE